MDEEFKYESVADFYSGKSVFITGATGLLGKMYVEKLAYSCVDIDKIYILVREKNGQPIEDRIHKLLQQPMFSRVKRERPEALEKIIPIPGDIAKPNLGITAEAEQILIQKVSVVIHCAATIKFNEPLKVAVNINVEGTKRLLDLSKRMKNIQVKHEVFVYVSTAYSNTNQKIIDEVVYPPSIELNELRKIVTQHYIHGNDEAELRKLLKYHPNTYTFTKSLAENLIDKEHGNVPTVIIRPAIISATEKEPIEGWIDNWSGATTMLTFIVKGWNHVVLSDNTVILDLIPLDYVTNLTLVGAAKCKGSDSVTVYNIATSAENPITIYELYQMMKEYDAKHHVCEKPFTVSLVITKYKILLNLITFLTMKTPCFVTDMIMRSTGKEAKYVKLQSKWLAARDSFEYFTSRLWKVRCEGSRALFNSLSAEDKKLFPCDPKAVIWEEYIHTYMKGIFTYLFNK